MPPYARTALRPVPTPFKRPFRCSHRLRGPSHNEIGHGRRPSPPQPPPHAPRPRCTLSTAHHPTMPVDHPRLWSSTLRVYAYPGIQWLPGYAKKICTSVNRRSQTGSDAKRGPAASPSRELGGPSMRCSRVLWPPAPVAQRQALSVPGSGEPSILEDRVSLVSPSVTPTRRGRGTTDPGSVAAGTSQWVMHEGPGTAKSESAETSGCRKRVSWKWGRGLG